MRTKVIPALKAECAQSLFDVTDDYVKVVVGKASVKSLESAAKVSVKSAQVVGKTSGKILSAISANAVNHRWGKI
ncbi:MAG: hypothetical protein JRE14_14185, partial [Deltaproteobacteria bacterium]|nr:hypothetical protein [Deltaproteobacteria bacterium]